MLADAFDGILFDLDGTMWDACDQILESWRRTLERSFPGEYMLEKNDLYSVFGLTRPQIAELMRPHYGDRTEEIVYSMMANEIEYLDSAGGGKLYEGLADTIMKLAGTKKLFVVSNCQKEYLDVFSRKSGLGIYFTEMICEGMTGRSKGDNAAYIVGKYALKSPLFVGDTTGDELAARKASCTFAYAAYGFGKAENPDIIIESICDLAR